MKRPLVLAALLSAAAAGLSISGLSLSLNIFVIFSSIILILFLKINKLPYYYCLMLIVFPVVFLKVEDTQKILNKLYEQSIAKDKNPDVIIKGKIEAVTDKETYLSIIVRDDKFGFITNLDKASLKESIHPGDIITLKGKVKLIDSPSNEGEFDSFTYYLSNEIHMKFDSEELVDVISKDNSIEAYAFTLRKKIKDNYYKLYSEENAGLISSIVLGDKSSIDSDIKDMYRKNGIAHLLAVSGLHISMVGMFTYNILKKKMRSIYAAFFSALLMMFYLIVTGNSVSAKRAVIMLLVVVLADILGRTVDMASSLALAVLIIICDNPYSILNTGFLMSVSAILGIILVYPVFSNEKRVLIIIPVKKKKEMNLCGVLLYRALDMLAACISIQLATLPVVVNTTYQLPIIGIAINCIVIPLMSIVMISGIISACFSLLGFSGVSGVFSFVFAGAGNYILDFYSWLCGIFDNIDFLYAVCGKPSLFITALYIAVLLLLCLIHFFHIDFKYDYILMILLLFIISNIHFTNKALMISMLDVGQGDCSIIKYKNDLTIMIDGGSSDKKQVGKYIIYQYLKYTGTRTVDYILVSHPDKDHISGIIELLDMMDNTFKIKCIVMPEIKMTSNDDTKQYLELVNLALEKNVEVKYAKSEDTINYNELSIRCIHPCVGYNYESSNDYSAIYRLKFGEFSALFTGDAEEKAENCMIQDLSVSGRVSDINVDLLKVGHHGSKYSSSDRFLSLVSPEISIISCGIDNKYGHPHTETIKRIEETGSKILRTDELGQIKLFISPSGEVKEKNIINQYFK